MSQVLHAPSKSESRLVQILDEYLAALQTGQAPSKEELLARYPELAGDLAECLESLEFIRQAAVMAVPAGEGTGDGAPGPQLGDFRIMREIGRGGMGVVYEAEQISLGRRVALKVLPFAGALDARQLQRFKNEAQAAAHLQHQNIVPVHFVGSERGVHFYAMQFIEGQTLAAVIADLRRQRGQEDQGLKIEDQSASRVASAPGAKSENGGLKIEDRPEITQDYQPVNVPAKSTIEARGPADDTPATAGRSSFALSPLPPLAGSFFFRTVANLGIQAAEALEHAHQMGIIHRDIKPSNLLLEPLSPPGERGRGEGAWADGFRLWITDFGLAHCQSQPGITMTGDLVGTLRYMSPEQALAKRVIVDHRTDIYSLGATLYELLTFEPVFTGHDRQELLRQIAFEEPLALRRINAKIPAELETIVLKALEKNPADRFGTTQDMADDLRRYVEEKPIRARRPTTIQRVSKLVRRHKAVFTGVALTALLTLALSTVLLLMAYQREAKAHQAEARRRQQAREALDAMSSQVIEDWLVKQKDLLPEHKAFLEKALASYEEFAQDTGQDEEVRAGAAEAFRRVGLIREKLGEAGDAEASYRQSQELYKQLAAEFPTSPDYRRGEGRGYTHLGNLLNVMGRHKEAETALLDALAVRKQLVTDFPTQPDYRYDLAGSQHNLALLLWDTGRPKESEAAYRYAITLSKQLAGEFPTRPHYSVYLARHLNGLGNLLVETGRHEEAKTAFRDSLTVRKQLVADFPTRSEYRQDLAGSHNNLGWMLSRTGRHKEAEPAYRDALAIYKQLTADFPTRPDYRQQVARSLTNLGLVLRTTGRPVEAETCYRDALTLQKQLAADFPTSPDYRSDLANSHNNLAVLLRQTARPMEAEPAYRDALAIYKQLTADFPTRKDYRDYLARSQNNLGELLADMRRLQEAEAAYRDALTLFKQLVADVPTRPDYREKLAGGHTNLAQLLKEMARPTEAETAYRDAITLLMQLAADFPTRAVYRNSLAKNLLGLKDHVAAAKMAEEFLKIAADPINGPYDAACFLSLCVPLAHNDDTLAEDQREKIAAGYADRAMVLLRQAVTNTSGLNDLAHMKKDADLDPLRKREDFKKLLSDMEVKVKSGEEKSEPNAPKPNKQD